MDFIIQMKNPDGTLGTKYRVTRTLTLPFGTYYTLGTLTAGDRPDECEVSSADEGRTWQRCPQLEDE